MQQTVKFKIVPSIEQANLLKAISKEYIQLVNRVVQDCVDANKALPYTSKTVSAALPSALKNQAIRDAKSVYKKYRKTGIQSILKKPVCIWNSQNWKLENGAISIPMLVNGKSKRVKIPTLLTAHQLEKLTGKLGSLRITKKSKKWIVQISVEQVEPATIGTAVIGVDLGLKCPAVAVTNTGKTKFFGNGRQNKYKKRHFRSLRKTLGKLKKLGALRKLNNKEQRWMKDQDHKISRAIVNFAVAEGVGLIRLEALSGIRQTARTSRKNEKNLHTWSFYRLAMFIEYKAILAGIKVEFVDPKYTSQKCPKCKTLNKAKDRLYACQCGFRAHRDRVGAINIIEAPVLHGQSAAA